MEFKKLLHRLSTQLNQIKNKNDDITKQANLSIISCRRTLSEMNQIVLNTPFKNEESEITFFKKIKAIPLCKLIYYSEILNFENQYPKANKKEQTKYIQKKIKKINKFYSYNLDFIQYIREDRTNFDALFYTRTNYDSLNYTNTSLYYRTPEFSTSHDFLLGKVKGFDMFIYYLQNKLNCLKGNNYVNEEKLKSNLKWTSSKAALTELIYALHSSGALNSGAADLKEIASVTEELFNIDLKDYYRTFIEIRARKIHTTKFIDKLKDSLIHRMEESDA